MYQQNHTLAIALYKQSYYKTPRLKQRIAGILWVYGTLLGWSSSKSFWWPASGTAEAHITGGHSKARPEPLRWGIPEALWNMYEHRMQESNPCTYVLPLPWTSFHSEESCLVFPCKWLHIDMLKISENMTAAEEDKQKHLFWSKHRFWIL